VLNDCVGLNNAAMSAHNRGGSRILQGRVSNPSERGIKGAETDAKGVERVGNGKGVPPPQPTRGSGERRKLPQRGLGGAPAAENEFGAFQL